MDYSNRVNLLLGKQPTVSNGVRMTDVLRKGRTYTKPKVRVWFHPKKGDDRYQELPYNKVNYNKLKMLANKETNSGYYEDEPLISWRGKEYSLKRFLSEYR